MSLADNPQSDSKEEPTTEVISLTPAFYNAMKDAVRFEEPASHIRAKQAAREKALREYEAKPPEQRHKEAGEALDRALQALSSPSVRIMS